MTVVRGGLIQLIAYGASDVWLTAIGGNAEDALPYNIGMYNSRYHVDETDGLMRSIVIERDILHHPSLNLNLPYNIRQEKQTLIPTVTYQSYNTGLDAKF